MTQQDSVRLERTSSRTARVTFGHPPVNLITGETVTRLGEIVRELDGDPEVQVVVFGSDVPDFIRGRTRGGGNELALADYRHSLTLPGFRSRAGGLRQTDPRTALDVEYRLGDYLGPADQRRSV